MNNLEFMAHLVSMFGTKMTSKLNESMIRKFYGTLEFNVQHKTTSKLNESMIREFYGTSGLRIKGAKRLLITSQVFQAFIR